MSREIKPMKKDQLLAICLEQISQALGEHDGELSKQRSTAMRYYLGKDYGNEISERSQVKTSEVFDTIETLMPFFIDLFAKNSDVIEFDPIGPDDEEQAKQETAYVRHVYWKENRGFFNTYTMIKDALLQKTGHVKIYWDESEKETREDYTNLNEVSLGELLAQDNVELIAQDTHQEVIQDEAGNPFPVTLYDVAVKCTEKVGKVVIDPLPPEDFLTSRRAVSPFSSDSPFNCHHTTKTVSELIATGLFKKQEILDAVTDGEIEDEEEDARDFIERSDMNANTSDTSQREVEVDECYLIVDFNGDGISEMRKVTIFGNKVQLNEEIDDDPFGTLVPNILPHQFHGLSMADMIMQLQLIQSTLLRQGMDNMYQMNNVRMAVGENVNLDDLLTTRPGGAIRMQNGGLPGNEILPIPIQPFVGHTFEAMNFMEGIRESRTGVAQNTQAINENVLNNNKGDISVQQVMSKAEERTVLVARIMAEGMKDIMLKVRALLVKHQDYDKQVKINGEWMTFNPSDWKERTDTTIDVGIGQGEKQQRIALLSAIKADQKEAMALGEDGILIDRSKMYDLQDELVKLGGLTGVQKYFIDPRSDESIQAQKDKSAKAQEPNFNDQILELQAEIEKLNAQTEVTKMTVQNEQFNKELQRKYDEMESDLVGKMTELELKYNTDVKGSAV